MLELAYTAHVRVNLLVPSPDEHSPFLDMTILTMQKMTITKALHVKVQLNKVLKNTSIVS